MKNRDWLRSACVVCGVWVLAWTAGVGCSRGPRSAPVDAAKARETLRAALESWKKGDKVDALQKTSPAIYVIDTEWQ